MEGTSEIRKETFADKVRAGGGMRFDPMLEEKGGWIAGEAQRHDIEMAEANDQIDEGVLNLFRGFMVRTFLRIWKGTLVGSWSDAMLLSLKWTQRNYMHALPC